ncbi:MAG: hypothetical protein JW816_03895 [Candidatus Buchananbacteria bacterium]|nr:hypothetical protein [Candidatus Buchananbacteria bacterium]
MSEQFAEGKEQPQETLEDEKYKAYQDAEERRTAIMREINEVLRANPDPSEVRENALKKLSEQMDQAMEESTKTFDEWMEAIKRARETETE